MKKQFLAWFLLITGAALLAAEDYDGKIKTAVNALAERLTSPIEVSIGDIFIEGTQTSSGLSRFLINRIKAHAPDTGKFNVTVRSRGIDRVTVGPQKGIITGEFMLTGDTVYVTLRLVSESDGRILRPSNFTLSAADLKKDGVEIMPAGVDPDKLIEEDKIIIPPTPPANAFKIEAWPDSDTHTYMVGDSMRINLLSSRDCYVKVYHIDVNRKMQLLFPNRSERDNLLRANTPTIIPKGMVSIIVEKPLGRESIWVMASTVQFPNLESEFIEIRNLSSDTVNNVRGTRGARLEYNPASGDVLNAETLFSITILEAANSDASYSYRKPANMAETVQAMRSEITGQGGTFSGNEREGTFSTSGTAGSYRVTGDTVTVNLRYTDNQIVRQTRGMGFNFSIEKPRNISQAVQSVRSGIENKGGTFSGNEQQGTFQASGITGQYNVGDRVTVSISEKPVLIPNALIEREVKNYFTGK